jgi:hypothetical protein
MTVMTDLHNSITPPPELVLQWLEDAPEDGEFGISTHIATQAARWGADQELEACCDYLTRCASWEPEDVQEMRDLLHPKPPSLKEQALQALEAADFADYPVIGTILTTDQHALIRRALEKLND